MYVLAHLLFVVSFMGFASCVCVCVFGVISGCKSCAWSFGFVVCAIRIGWFCWCVGCESENRLLFFG